MSGMSPLATRFIGAARILNCGLGTIARLESSRPTPINLPGSCMLSERR